MGSGAALKMGSGAAWGSSAEVGSATGAWPTARAMLPSLMHLFTPAWRQHLLKHKRVLIIMIECDIKVETSVACHTGRGRKLMFRRKPTAVQCEMNLSTM